MTRYITRATAAAVLAAGELAIAGAANVRADAPHGLALTKLPAGYRDWRLISVAHAEGPQNDIRAILGNDIAFTASQNGVLPFPKGAIIARVAWKYVSSEENNRAFGRTQSFIAGAPTNVQFMVKDADRFSATGGWGFVQFNEGEPADPALSNACFACHVPVSARDYVFTRYSP